MRMVRCDGSPDTVATLAEALAAALDGGRPVLPIGDGPDPAIPDQSPEGVALIVETSGSTGEPKRVVLGAAALRASATATHARLGGPGRWLLALPAHHIAGVQVIVRALLAGHPPAVLDLRGGFRPAEFASAATELLTEGGADERYYTSLVPTQLHRVLAAGGTALDTLGRFDAVLVGGAATPPTLLADARRAGVAVVTTYGMSETAGGCVYNGVPLDGVRVRLAQPDGRIWLAGPTLADGYLGAPARTAEHFVDGWFRTSDLGAWERCSGNRGARDNGARDSGARKRTHGARNSARGIRGTHTSDQSDSSRGTHTGDESDSAGGESAVLRVLGRADDVITTGGEKVHPAAVERVLTSQPGVRAACVVGLEDPEWGQRVAAAVVPVDPAILDRGRLIKAVRTQLGRSSVPKQLRMVDELPRRGIGKPDRVAVARLLAERAAHATVTTVATLGEWISGARPRTLPNAVAPVLVGTGAAIGTGAPRPLMAGLALLVAISLVIGVNYANDYSDGVRGADANRVGPRRLVGSGTATPAAVRTMALAWLSAALLAGLAVVALSRQWWLLGVGAFCVLGAWCYTGGKRPYGYRGFGEVAVFLFFGPVAVLGTAYVQGGPPGALAWLAATGTGLLSSSVLVVNNLRDIATDPASGKRTLAVVLGELGTRRLYAALIAAPIGLSVAAGLSSRPMLLGLVAVPLAYSPVRRVLRGATGRLLTTVLAESVIVLLAWSIGSAVGLALT